MKTFHTYRDGLPPGPGIFATAESVDKRGTAVRIGDVVQDTEDRQGVVVAIGGPVLIYLVCEPDETFRVNWFNSHYCREMLIVGHAYDVLREVARIEAAGDATPGRL